MNEYVVSGSKGGGSKPKNPYEMPDNLISVDKIKILLAVSDGECDPEFSLKNLYLDNVPVENADGSRNYNGVTAEFRPGTQDQEYIKGFTDTSSEITLARDITKDTPYVISVTNNNLSAIRVKIMMPTGVTQENDGDKVGVRVQWAVDMAVDGAAYERVLTDTIDGKTTNGYDRARRIDLPAFNERVLLRVSRITPDSTTLNVVDKIQLHSYAEVVDAKFRYPLTGLVYVEFNSELFPNQIPNIAIKKKWKIVNVPTNYDPESRTYSGTWDGIWKKAWTNNPAFVLYDLIVNQRYGLDQRELGIALDKWSIYEAAQYCDQMVPDGKGGTEPRYLCDVVIQSQIEAYQLIRDICSIFRGMSFWNGESLSIIVDRPRDPAYIFTNDNVVNGNFDYTFASEKSMYTQCNVTFDDAQNMYEQDVEGVFDTEAALRFGYNPTSITAIGCTRRSEANRRGRWILKTNLRSTTVNFATGLEGMIPMIGDVIAIADNFYSNALTLNLSGRVAEVQGVQVFTQFKVDARPGDFIMINKPDGKPVKRTIANVSSDGKVIELNIGFGFSVQPDTVFAIDRTDVALQQYVVTGISRGDNDEEFTYSITAVEYDPNKYDEIDYGVNIDDRPTSVVPPDVLLAPENVKVSSYSRVVQGMSVETMLVTWDKVEYASLYEMQWRKDNGNWNNTPQTASTEMDVEGIYAGNYHVRVRSVSSTGSTSAWSEIVSVALTGKIGEPDKPINLTASESEVFGIRVKWGMPDGSGDTAYIELQQAPDGVGKPLEDQASLLTLVPYPQHEYWHSILPAGFINWYRVRSVDRIGNVSAWTDFVKGMSSTDTSVITDHIKVDIENSEGFQYLKENAIASNDKIHANAESAIENALANDKSVRVMRVENGKRKAEIKQSLQMIADETQARITAMQQLSVEFDDKIGAQYTEMVDLVAKESEARTEAINQIQAEIDDDIKAQITTVSNAIAKEEEVRASEDKALSAELDGQKAALNQKLDSWSNAESTGAQYGVKLGLTYNGKEYSAGMSMELVGAGDAVRSMIIFDAQRFAISNGIGSGSGQWSLPFVVENDQVFINKLFVKDGSIENAKIGQYIRSYTYTPGEAGWNIDKNGDAEFNNVTVRGTVYATDGEFKGTVYATNGKFKGDIEAVNFVGDVANMAVGWDKSNGSNAGEISWAFNYNDSSESQLSKNVMLSVYISSTVNAGGKIQVRFECDGKSKTIPAVTNNDSSGFMSYGSTVSCGFTGITASNVTAKITVIKTGAPNTQCFSPIMLMNRGTGNFSVS